MITCIKSKQIIIKTTFHSFQAYYKGVFDCMRQMTQKEGLLSLYKGILPPVLVETPKRAVKFLTFEQYKQFFMFGSDKATPIV
jgi:solute carrier family 25 (mitochondrial 2-oxodicarboxylate transporter), member 21